MGGACGTWVSRRKAVHAAVSAAVAEATASATAAAQGGNVNIAVPSSGTFEALASSEPLSQIERDRYADYLRSVAIGELSGGSARSSDIDHGRDIHVGRSHLDTAGRRLTAAAADEDFPEDRHV